MDILVPKSVEVFEQPSGRGEISKVHCHDIHEEASVCMELFYIQTYRIYFV